MCTRIYIARIMQRYNVYMNKGMLVARRIRVHGACVYVRDAYYIDKLRLPCWLILYRCACERARVHYRTACIMFMRVRRARARLCATLEFANKKRAFKTRYVYRWLGTAMRVARMRE